MCVRLPCTIEQAHEILLNFSDIHNAHSKFIKRYLIAENEWYKFVAQKREEKQKRSMSFIRNKMYNILCAMICTVEINTYFSDILLAIF